MPSASKPRSKAEYAAEDIFTDREEPRAAFWNVYNGMQSGDYEVLNYYGVGGIGKTTLLKKIRDEMEERIPGGASNCAYFSFEGSATKEVFLFNLSRQMMLLNKGLTFPIFDAAFEKIAKEEGKDISQIAAQEKDSFLNNPILDTAINVGSIFLPNLGVAYSAVKAVEYLFSLGNAKSREKSVLAGEYAKDYMQIQTQPAAYIKKRLHEYFKYDVYECFSKRDTPFVIFLDGYEKLVSLLSDGKRSQFADGWLGNPDEGLVVIPNVLWVIAGREKLNWNDELLPPEHMHRMGDISEKDSISFFEKAGIDEALWLPLYRLTEGTPVYMDLCVNTYRTISCSRTPTISDFGKSVEDIADRFLRDMNREDQMLMFMFSWFPNVWDTDMLDSVMRTLKYDPYRLRVEALLRLSLFERVSEGYRLHGTFSNIVRKYCDENTAARVKKAILVYYKEWLLNSSPEIYRMRNIKEFADSMAEAYDSSLISEEELEKIVGIVVEECLQTGDYYAWDRVMSILCHVADGNNMSAAMRTLCHNKYVHNMYALGQYEKMFTCAKETYEYALNELGEDSIYYMDALDNLANAHDNLQYYDEAIELQGKCYELRKITLGEEHPDTLRSLSNLADTYNTIKRYEIARDLHKKCFDARKKLFGTESVATLRSMNNYACTLEMTDEPEEAARLREECYLIRSRVLGREHPDTMRSLEAMAGGEFKRGNADKALEMLEECRRIREDILGPEHPLTVRTAEKIQSWKAGR